MEIRISDHARLQAERRAIPIDSIYQVAASPQQIFQSHAGRLVCQSELFDDTEGKNMLLRAVVKDIGNVRHVITIYKTSKIEKYKG